MLDSAARGTLGVLIREGAERTVQVDLRLASILATVAGAINTAGFQAAGWYSANMTGNVSALSQCIAFDDPLALLYAGIVFIFIFGAFVSAQLISFGSRHNARGAYAFSIMLEGVLLAASASPISPSPACAAASCCARLELPDGAAERRRPQQVCSFLQGLVRAPEKSSV